MRVSFLLFLSGVASTATAFILPPITKTTTKPETPRRSAHHHPLRATENDAFLVGVGETLTKLVNGVETELSAALQKVPGISDAALNIHIPPELHSAIDAVRNTLVKTTTPPLDLNAETLAQLSAAALNPLHLAAISVFAVGSLLVAFVNSPIDFSEAPFEPGTDTYSPKKSDEFYAQRPIMILKRILKLGFVSGVFSTGLLFDWLVLGKLFKDEEYTALKKGEPRRAKQSVVLCEQLGPTFIKLGQALSIRQDLIPESYALELRKLQDAVPPFDNDLAYSILKKEFDVQDLNQIFAELTEDPVAAASVGQVYRGVLAANGKDVAVKIQRPGILAEIALDLYILRLITPIQTRIQNAVNGASTTQEDIDLAIGLVDEWGRGFVAETDYGLEAKNTINFEAAMRERGLDAVCAPTVVTELVRDKVLVTEWVEGTRLDLDASADIPRLCGVAINAYLTMLLDTGVLHCDPHKGNLLRTTDGRLCILDWGMTLEVPKDLQYALLEFIAHINTEDYDAIPQDFINLGFSPPDVTAERLKSSGITEGLSFAFRQLAGGGGPKKIQERVKAEFQERYGSNLSDEEIQTAARAEMLERMETQLASEGVNVKGVTNVMEEMSRRNRELFALPPYVLYLARAFSTLEGIGLSIDEDYSIVQECYPYLSSRLFTDRNPRAKKALRAMLGLTDDENESIPSSQHSSALSIVQAGAAGDTLVKEKKPAGLSPKKLMEMSEGFASYTAATTDVDRDGKGQAAAATEFSKLFFDPKGSTLQDIFVDETAKLGDAMARAALRAALIDNPAAKAATSAFRAPKQIAEQNEQIFNLMPKSLREAFVDRPSDFSHLVESLIASTEEDERILSTAQELRDTFGPRVLGAINGKESGSLGVLPEGTGDSVTSLLANEETRKAVTEQLPGVAALGRRVGAGLLRRAAYRTEKSSAFLPESARKRLIDANNALADAIEPKEGEAANKP
jgi:predicted unusual protein kinase regulating ubiquinone biosynthesis (AarF/ABC1/UbiB family)